MAGNARTIAVVTLPAESFDDVREGRLHEALDPTRFEGVEDKMKQVAEFVDALDPIQQGLLLTGLGHSLEDAHGGRLQFVEYQSGYDIEGIGLEIKDDTVTEEELTGPVRVMFVVWNLSSS